MTGNKSDVNAFVDQFDQKFKLRTFIRGPGNMKFYGISIVQLVDFSSTIDVDEKLVEVEGCPLAHVRHRQFDVVLNKIELSTFMFVNSSIGWSGFTASQFCAFYSTYLQQKMPSSNVSFIM